jgi:3-hydroxyacyl-[acyl-carrier-protein] dehydratase
MADDVASTIGGFGVLEIMKMIPHRYPFLLVDRIDSITPHVSATAFKNVSINEPFFQGHFPDRPIMPGVLIVEALAQTAAIHTVASMGGEAHDKLVYFMSIDGAKFRKPVEPGDTLRLVVTQQQARGRVRRYRGEAFTAAGLATEAEFTAMIADKPAA